MNSLSSRRVPSGPTTRSAVVGPEQLYDWVWLMRSKLAHMSAGDDLLW